MAVGEDFAGMTFRSDGKKAEEEANLSYFYGGTLRDLLALNGLKSRPKRTQHTSTQ